ncbi:MAG: prolyl oligopeptidase family serine peptidase [Bacteroidales bacterium]|nr:prolyl oligopeptidase family serine peptidase [Bacteroidales bacterium]
MNRKIFFFIFLLQFLLFSCGTNQPNTDELKKKYGDLSETRIKLIPVDYTKTPINKKIKHHPENYIFLDKIDIFSMAYLSDGLFITGFLVAPKNKGNFPTVILNRGGAGENGRLLVANAVEIMAPIAAEGYVVAASNYRGNSGSEGKEEFGGAEVRDVLNLIDALSYIQKADTSKVGLLGISRGGMMNYLTLLENDHSHIRAVVSIGGITDLITTIDHHTEIGEVAKTYIPEFQAQPEESLKKRSVVYRMKELPDSIPLLILHSTSDTHVTYKQIPAFEDSLKKYDIPYKLISFENDTHGLSGNKEEVFRLILDWFNTYLKS